MMKCYRDIGYVYYGQGNYEAAFQNYWKALETAEEYGNKMDISACLNNIGNIYSAQANYPKAIEYYQKSLNISEDIGDDIGVTSCFNNIGNIYNYQANYTMAFEYYQKSLKISKKIGSKSDISGSLSNIGSIYFYQGNYIYALKYFQESLRLYEELGDKKNSMYCLNNIGSINIELRNFQKAVEYLQKALVIAEKTDSKKDLSLVYRNLSEAYDSLCNYSMAYEYLRMHKQADDSLLNEESRKKLIEIQTRYETEKKEKEIILLNQKTKDQELWILLGIILSVSSLCVIILLFFIGYNRYRHKQKLLMTEAIAEQQKLRFKEVIEAGERERKRIAEDLHDSLGQMLSTARLNMAGLEDIIHDKDSSAPEILKTAIALIDESCMEARNISHNIMPGALIKLGLIPAAKELIAKINKSAQIKIELNQTGFDSRLSESYEIAIYRIIQEVLSNIIRHAEATQVNIILLRDNNSVKLNVCENGKGFDITQIEKSTGMGWKNIFSRVAMLNGTIKIDAEPGSGTSIDIHFHNVS